MQLAQRRSASSVGRSFRVRLSVAGTIDQACWQILCTRRLDLLDAKLHELDQARSDCRRCGTRRIVVNRTPSKYCQKTGLGREGASSLLLSFYPNASVGIQGENDFDPVGV